MAVVERLGGCCHGVFILLVYINNPYFVTTPAVNFGSAMERMVQRISR